MDARVLCFLLENYDIYAKATRAYQCIYYEMRNGQQNEVELVDQKTGSRFLSKRKTPVLLAQLTLGSTVNFNGRNFDVVAYLDEKTKAELGRRHEPLVLVLPPNSLKSVGKLIDAAVKLEGFRLGRMKTMRLSRRSVGQCVGIFNLDSMDKTVLGVAGVCTVVEFFREDSHAVWMQMYRKLRQVVRNCFACPKAKTGEAQEFFFGPSQPADVSTSSADVMGNPGPMSLCLLKPHTIEQDNVGAIIDDIASNFDGELVAIDKINLSKTDAAEFYACYKFLPNLSDHITHFASGPCVAMCIRGESVTQRLRDFVGPFDVAVAKHLAPGSIRAKFGYNRVRNAVHVTDMAEDGLLECNFVFNTLRL